MSIAQLKTKVITHSAWGDEQVVIREMTGLEYQTTLAYHIQEYGTDNTWTEIKAGQYTPIVAAILNRISFEYIVSWTLKDANNNIMQLAYENYSHLPFAVIDIIQDGIADLRDKYDG